MARKALRPTVHREAMADAAGWVVVRWFLGSVLLTVALTSVIYWQVGDRLTPQAESGMNLFLVLGGLFGSAVGVVRALVLHGVSNGRDG